MTTVLITGASSGLGVALAHAYASGGASTVLAAPDIFETGVGRELHETYGMQHLLVPTDVTKPKDVEMLFELARNEFGTIDTVINNAGKAYFRRFLDLSLDELEDVRRVIADGALHVHYHGLRHFRDARVEHPCIVNILSQAVIVDFENNGTYGPSKTFSQKLSRVLATEHNEVAFINIYPGIIDTPMMREENCRTDVLEYVRRQPTLDPTDVAAVVISLSEQRRSVDVYLEQKTDGPYASYLWFPKPLEQRARELERLMRKGKNSV